MMSKDTNKLLASKDVKRLLFILIPIMVGSIIAIVSSMYLGNDNPVEEKIETYIENSIEEELDLPKEFLDGKVDFTPASEEN